MAKGLRQLKVIVALDGSAPILSTVAVAPADQLALMSIATASLLPGSDGLPGLLVVQLAPAPPAPELEPVTLPAVEPKPPPIVEPQESPSPPHRLTLTTEDGRILTSEDGVPLVLPDDLNGP